MGLYISKGYFYNLPTDNPLVGCSQVGEKNNWDLTSMASYGTGTQRKIVSSSLTIHPSWWCMGGCWFIVARVNQLAPTSAPTWMDGALIEDSLFYPCAIPGSLFLVCPDLSFLFWNFIFSSPPPTQFLFLFCF